MTGHICTHWRAGMTTLFDVPARQAPYCRLVESIPGLLKHLQIQSQYLHSLFAIQDKEMGFTTDRSFTYTFYGWQVFISTL